MIDPQSSSTDPSPQTEALLANSVQYNHPCKISHVWVQPNPTLAVQLAAKQWLQQIKQQRIILLSPDGYASPLNTLNPSNPTEQYPLLCPDCGGPSRQKRYWPSRYSYNSLKHHEVRILVRECRGAPVPCGGQFYIRQERDTTPQLNLATSTQALPTQWRTVGNASETEYLAAVEASPKVMWLGSTASQYTKRISRGVLM